MQSRQCGAAFLHGLLLTVCCALAACGGGEDASTPVTPPPTTYSAASGVAQKGPLIKGSTVTAQELNASLSPTGQQFSYQVTTNLGAFAPTSTFTSQYIGLSATGYYYDELQNAVSKGTVTLSGYSDLSVDPVLNVNLLTTLAYQRIENLVNSGQTFTAARTEAENEVLAALDIPPGNYGSFGTLDIGANTDGDHILAAISCLFVYGNSAGPLSQLIANFQSDLGANGVITNAATKAALIAAAKAVNPAIVAANLTSEYASAGVAFTAADIAEWIAQSGDGVIGKFAFQVPDATPSTVFTFPASVVSQFAGTLVHATAGQLSVNGTIASGAVTFNSGDTITLVPGPGAFPNGVLTAYLATGGTTLAKVSFVSGLTSISVTPTAPSLAVGLTQQYTATGTFSDTSTANLTSSVAWASSTPTFASVGAATGLATAVATGTTTIIATSGPLSGSATLTVTPAVVESISITPNPAMTGVGISLQLTATGTYSDGTISDVTTSATWTSSAISVANVGPTTGIASGVALGSTTISAGIGTVTSSTALSVVSNSWFPTDSLRVGRVGHTATLLSNGKVLVAGGAMANGTLTATAELYDPVSGTWSPTGSLATARSGHTATMLQNGKILVVGGTSIAGGGTTLTSAELYDPNSGTWSATGGLATARSGHLAVLLADGNVLVTAGNANANVGPALASAELYNPAAGTWSVTGNMALARVGGTATLLSSGAVLVDSGTYEDPIAPQPDELYDPVAGTWSVTGGFRGDLYAQTATLLPDGEVLVAGGTTVGSDGNNTTCSLYNPATGTWVATGSMTTGRASHTATLLPNGKVLVAGGIVNEYGTLAANAEVYDPGSGSWSPAGTMATPVANQTATLLTDGVVLVAGGSSGGVTAAAELYW